VKISIADSFLDSARGLDSADARRASAFVEKLVVARESAGLHPEIVHGAAAHAVRSFRVTQDMRAIAHMDCGRLLLLFVAHHDAAYAWARNHCIECIIRGEEVRVRLTMVAEDDSRGIEPVSEGKACLVETLEELRALLTESGIPLASG
jgi:hypothetical protein